MLPTNTFRMFYMALTAVTSISFQSGQVAAGETARCGTGFRPSDQTRGWYRKDFMFNGCTEWGYNSPTGKVGINFHVHDFKADNTARTVCESL
ncbi:hypothetical protein PSHT_01319 [Puccinia striiformis]|uniref:Secreted protein n=1 Tax=Puccinia striiformis TaxID=27350 RepID=A0A2S4WKW7_9BASI|nr:hypothetical protein PSHT_01319 [Puccinia striiformis]